MSEVYHITDKVDIIGADLQSPLAIGQVEMSTPFLDSSARRISQKYAQLLTHWQPLPLGTMHPTYTNAVLTEETSTSEVGGGVVEWSRIFHELPEAALSEYTTTNFTFPELWNGSKYIYVTTNDGDGDDTDGDDGGTVVITEEKENWAAFVRGKITKTVVARKDTYFYNLDTVYYMPNGEPITSPVELPSAEIFTPKIAGYPVGYIDENTSPTFAEYIANYDWVVAGDTVIQRWQGNLYKIIFTFVQKQ